ncbi:MAG TPA: hypothetical protein PLO44_00260 [Candidatus Paceibacterota bacterium]|nr:hypothetical protein [Candidatus Paceibacterota bacterium]
MENELAKIMKKAGYQAEPNLSEDIWRSIVLRQKKAAKIKLTLFSITSFVAFVGAFPIFKNLATQFAQSGFYEYLSLAFSNVSGLAGFWKELVYSIAETLPVSNILLSCAVVFIFFLSARYALKQVIRNQELAFN